MNDSAPLIHPTAVIDPSARLADDVRVGAFSLIGADVEIGAGTVVGPHCSIHGPTRIGRDNRFIGHAAIGGEPQDKKYAGERTELVIGDRNVFREFVTVNRGTGGGGGVTRIGNDNWVIISGFAGAHQFCRIGDHAFLGMGALVTGDIPPFTMVGIDGHGRPRGINSEGLKRRGFDPARIGAIKRAYRTLYVAGIPLAEAKQQLAEQARDSDDVRQMLDFIEHADRPLQR